MKKLKLVFVTQEGKRQSFYPHVDKKIDESQIKAAVDYFLQLEKNTHEKMFVKLEKASWIETKTTHLIKRYKQAIYYPNSKNV
ncbi:DUF2922 family protein [Enterococcus saccharolyticus]|uniref:Uncharacterized protein n=1 Tax=Candidatus Enterococcus willemsii TaxID=1857215 RepID=A0ABQ6YZE3_9ENTE|nr:MULTISPECIES: DUF2922 family protein [Enterococcus]KAF1303994.1 hypothetical protein BAU17_03655 [Enterococcus sp. CU12B]MCD5002148.1 DUF2922 family protein [Enterococcus saccharolyticus]